MLLYYLIYFVCIKGSVQSTLGLTVLSYCMFICTLNCLFWTNKDGWMDGWMDVKCDRQNWSNSNHQNVGFLPIHLLHHWHLSAYLLIDDNSNYGTCLVFIKQLAAFSTTSVTRCKHKFCEISLLRYTHSEAITAQRISSKLAKIWWLKMGTVQNFQKFCAPVKHAILFMSMNARCKQLLG